MNPKLRNYRREEVLAFARDIIKQYTPETQPLGFWLFDIQSVENAVARWKKAMPSVRPCFAVKCNPEPHLVKLLGELGCGFDCATINEIKEVVKLGFNVQDIIFSQTVKPYDQLIESFKMGVMHSTVDSVDEIQKIAKYAPGMGVVIRVMENDPTAGYTLGDKFGIYIDEATEMIEEIKKHNLRLDGVHFHVGSGFQEEDVFRRALRKTKEIVDIAHKYGLKPYLFDLGGGFTQEGPFEKYGQVIEETIKELKFPEGSHFIGEPGRYMATYAWHLVSSIHGRRIRHRKENEVVEYTVGDGIHGNFGNITLFGERRYCESATSDEKEKVFKSVVYGCTCDGSDIISEVELPMMESGKDWIIFPNNGAYTMSLCTNFNGFVNRNMKIYMLPSANRQTIEIDKEIEEKSIPALNSYEKIN